MAKIIKSFAGRETRNVLKNGKIMDAEISVYHNYFPLLWIIPLFRNGKSYKIRFPEIDETYVDFIPEEYREICEEIGRKY